MSKERTTVEQRWVLALTSIGSVMVALDVLVVAAALTTIRQDLGASMEQLEWTVNAYSLSFAMLLMTAAAIGDRLGRRRTFAAGLALFTVASIGCALATSVPSLIAARTLQGAGAAMVMPLAMGLLGAAFPAERRGWAIGVFSGITGLAVLGGPMIGGAVTQGLAWQWIFWINVPVGVLAIPLVLRRIPESRGPVRRLDPRGATLITLAVLGLVWGVVRGAVAGWTSPEVVGSFVLGALLLLGFLAWEKRAAEPMVPLSFFRVRAFSAGNTAGFFLSAALFSAVFFVAQFMQAVLGSGPLKAGLQLLPWTATLFVVAPIAGRLVDRIGERPIVVVGLVLNAIGMAWIGLVADPGVHYISLVPPMIVAGCGISMAMPATQSASIGSLPREAVGIASGIYGMTRQLGGAVGVAILAAVFATNGGYGSPASFSAGFTRALVVCGVLSLAGALAGLGIAVRRTEPSAGPAVAMRSVEEVG
ncbi:MFS transporter [Kribbella qitaiheensis]|uniref:MFS transporter n=1 Tax=Kribbella qitaiheensis TaxID=1544730 RepID=A0A7G6X239_9ACTN|nr:MFS transporter [Kribbella qitaiheensis]QNE20304.1 MFS transporter [Kribbella qitaiheensis]